MGATEYRLTKAVAKFCFNYCATLDASFHALKKADSC